MFSAQILLAGNGASVTCLRESREPITTLNLATYVTPLVVRNFWLCTIKAKGVSIKYLYRGHGLGSSVVRAPICCAGCRGLELRPDQQCTFVIISENIVRCLSLLR